MLRFDVAKKIAHGPKRSQREQLLVALAVQPCAPISAGEIRKRCVNLGLPKLAKKNVSDILGKASGGVVARTQEGWELLEPGMMRVQELAQEAKVNLVITNASNSLRAHADVLTDPQTKSFVMEAITCFEAHQYRAAVVFSWAGAVAVLHQHVFRNKLREFNTEGARRDPKKWREVKQQDDLGRTKEHDFLDICEALGVLGKNVKQILQNECLALRNGCGHPNSMAIAENSAAAHIEKLIKNVFSRF